VTYVPTTWVDDVPAGTGTPLNAANLNHLEAGVAAALPGSSAVAANTGVFSNKLSASDVQPAFQIMGDGKLRWGPGGSTPFDTTLYRSAVNSLKTDSQFRAAQYVRAWDGTANQVLLGWNGPQSVDGPAISFGPANDAAIYRLGAGQLATDGALFVGPSPHQIQLSIDGGIYFAPYDTAIYRSSAGVVSLINDLTARHITASGNVTVNGNLTVSGSGGVQKGSIPSAARAQGINDVAVTFPTPFATAPAVVTNVAYSDGINGNPATSAPVNITTTGFTFRMQNADSQTRNMRGWWIAS